MGVLLLRNQLGSFPKLFKMVVYLLMKTENLIKLYLNDETSTKRAVSVTTKEML